MTEQAALTRGDALGHVLAALERQFGVAAETLSCDTVFEDDLPLDSVDVTELLIALEQATGCVIDLPDHVGTIGDVVAAMVRVREPEPQP